MNQYHKNVIIGALIIGSLFLLCSLLTGIAYFVTIKVFPSENINLADTTPIATGTTNIPLTNGPTVHIDWVTIIAGDFRMGCTDQEAHESLNYCRECDISDEIPAHMVYLPTYEIMRYEVTNIEYAACVMAGGCQSLADIAYLDDGFKLAPVTSTSWDDAQSFCNWVDARLPTEAEWEKAARGTDGRLFPWGNQAPDCSLANSGSFEETCFEYSVQVGSYPAGASPFGVMDMAGNADEWVSDWYDYAYYANSPTSNPQGPETGTFKVIRGGAFGYKSFTVRSTDRDGTTPDVKDPYIGFRCARTP